MRILVPGAHLISGKTMLILLCAFLACRATPVEPGVSLQPPLTPSVATEQGCARLDVRVRGRETITVEDDTVEVSAGGACGGLRPVISGIPEFDRTTNRVRLPVALNNNGTSPVQAPARLYGWEDSLTVIEAPGLAQNEWTASYLDFVAPDSALADTAATFPGALLWQYDTLLAQAGLAVGDTSGLRWIELSVHSGVQRFEVVFHAQANALSTEKPVIPSEATWPDDSMHTVTNPDDTAWVYYRTIAEVRFDDSTSGATINAFIAKYNAQIVGGIRGQKSYIMQFPDPGPTWQDLMSRTQVLQSESGVLWVVPISRKGGTEIFHSRLPNDAVGHTHLDCAQAARVIQNPVPIEPPDSIPAWVFADSNVVDSSAYISGAFLKNILIVRFRRGTTQAERQAAIDTVGGAVVGGVRFGFIEGDYVVRVNDPGDGSQLLAAADFLMTLPQIRYATIEVKISFHDLRPHDGEESEQWQMTPDAAEAPRVIHSPVPIEPPDSIPAWVFADSNVVDSSAYISGAFIKNILIVRFRRGTTQAERQAAIDTVGGTVVGGVRFGFIEGDYVVRVNDPGDGSQLLAAADLFMSLPQVRKARIEVKLHYHYLRPDDGEE